MEHTEQASPNVADTPPGRAGRWLELAGAVLNGHRLSEAEGLAVLRSGDEELLDLLAGAYRVRYRWHGNRVALNLLVSAKSGLCGEDCGYCAQSRVSQAAIPRYGLLDAEQLLAGARLAAERRAGTYCIVISGRSPDERELEAIERIVPRIKASIKTGTGTARQAVVGHSALSGAEPVPVLKMGTGTAPQAVVGRLALSGAEPVPVLDQLKICVSPGLLTVAQAMRLKACGVDRINHNLNTSERFYAQICSTHSYLDRLDTLAAVRQAGLEICSGGIIGMGEAEADVVELALRLGALRVEAVPLNFFQPIAGTPLAEGGGRREEGGGRVAGDCKLQMEDAPSPPAPLPKGEGRHGAPSPSAPLSEGEGRRTLDPRYCLKVLALFRLANPRCELRIAAGREMHLRSLQPLGLYAANSIFVGDYLTTKGQPPEADFQMLDDLGMRGEGCGIGD